ncbi:ATP/GTP-binding protein [Pseudomonas protegens]|uniref:AAA family ATPase n=1 Tax=Pseudomonas protegens TaxID=380021 RepID=UPI0037FE5AC5
MLSSTSKGDSHLNCFEDDSGDLLLKSALLFGPNASGKSNFIKSAYVIRDLVMNSIANVEEGTIRKFVPFLLNKKTITEPSEVEISFYSEHTKYRYGVSVTNGKVIEEWLYYTPEKRETLLYHRTEQTININKAGFSEGSRFVKNNEVQQTREDVPFLSVVASFNGEHATRVLKWFKKLHIISGSNDHGFKAFTINLLEKDSDFKTWILGFLLNFQIHGINIKESPVENHINSIKAPIEVAQQFIESLKSFAKPIKTADIFVVKRMNGVEVEFPIAMESEGTKKIIYMLGPIYDSMKNGNVLLVDEMDSKFHTLLTKYVFSIFHKESNFKSQIVAAVQDVNLMDPACFRRDQIWFVDKDAEGGSSLYSLVEYKEKNRAIRRHFGEEYLSGAYGAIPLFDNHEDIEKLMESKDGK